MYAATPARKEIRGAWGCRVCAVIPARSAPRVTGDLPVPREIRDLRDPLGQGENGANKATAVPPESRAPLGSRGLRVNTVLRAFRETGAVRVPRGNREFPGLRAKKVTPANRVSRAFRGPRVIPGHRAPGVKRATPANGVSRASRENPVKHLLSLWLRIHR